MTKRTVGFAVLALAITLLLLAVASALIAGSAPNAQAAAQPAQPGSPHRFSVSTWVDIAPFPTVTVDFTPGPQSLKLKRAGAAAYHPNGRIYVLGGRHGADGEDINMRNIFEYDPGADTWSQKMALLDSSDPGERATANMAVAVLTDTNGVRIYAIGGNDINSNPSSTVRIYDPVADSLSTLASADDWPASPARVPGGYAVHENKLYIFGGFSRLGAGAVYADTWVFDPLGAEGAKWTLLTSNLGLTRGYIAGATLDGKIYAVGGDTWNAGTHQLIPQTIVERYDPLNPGLGWVTMASIPTARGDMSAWAYNTGTGFEISGKVVIGGGVYPIPDNASYIYDPSTNSWNNFPLLNHATRNYAAAQLNGILYAFGGYDYSNNFPDGANYNQKYDATGPTATPSNTPIFSPTSTSTPFSTDYSICSGTGTIDPAPNLINGSKCKDCIVTINLPFAYTLYDQSFTLAELSSNGSLGFTQVDVNPALSCLPDAAAINSIFGYWDDLTTLGSGNGIFTSTVGTTPNRVFNLLWRGTNRISAQIDFEIRLFEGQTYFEIIYGLVGIKGGLEATVGVQKGAGSLYTEYKCAESGPLLFNGQKLTFRLAAGVCPTNAPTITPTITPTRTPTRTRTPTSTPTPEVVNLVGHVTWQQIPQPNARSQQPITLTLKLGATEVNYPVQNTDSSGFFTVSVSGLPAGTYDWRVKGPKWLANSGTVALPGSGTTQQEMGMMRAGDCNDSNIVNIVDFSILQATFGQSLGDPNYDARADFNGDDVVNITDFNLLKTNFGTGGSPPIGPRSNN